MGLKRALRSSVAAICIATAAAPAGVAAPAERAPRASGLEVRVAQAKTFSRVEFRGGGKPVIAREGASVVLTFGRGLQPDLSRLRTSPPPWFKGAELRSVGGRAQVVLQLTDDAEVSFGSADGAVYVNAFAKPKPAAAPAAQTAQTAQATPAPVSEPAPVRPNPVPAGGVVRMGARIGGGQVVLTFPWANPNGAAVFRRGDAVWMVFDAPAGIDVSQAPRGLTQFTTVQAFRGADYAAVRIAARAGIPLSVSAQGGVWSLALGAGHQAPAGLVRLVRDDTGGPAGLKAPVAGLTRIVRVADPYVGDQLAVATALGPAKGLPSRREFVQVAFLPSTHGLALEPLVDDLSITHAGDLVMVGRPKGLALSPQWAAQDRRASTGGLKPAAMPALIDYANWPKTGAGGFLERYNGLLATASDEAAKGRDAPVEARMAFARFLVGSELSFEAIGVLNALGRAHPQVMDQAEFRGLRGAARVMARRYKEAETDFSSPALADDPSSALWRGYINAQLARWTEARQQFDLGAEAFSHVSPVWKARFARSDAEAAMALGDIAGAKQRIDLALADKTDAGEELATRLVQARVAEAQGSTARALRIYQVLTRAPMESVSTPAMLRATQIKLETGKITPVQAVQVFDGLRYRWRGDGAELEIIRALGNLYLNQGRYREALEALRSAGRRLPDRPEARALQSDLAVAFRGLFMDGVADGLEPIQALALFYDFKELTPIGADGDLMVRKLVRRLVDVDLLDQAAELLRYQVENRLDGVPRAQVATDLAVIYLMARKPEQALQAINGSRTTILPTALNAERRVIEARAWTGLGRYENAVEILGKDTSPAAQELRAEIGWKQKDWPVAGATFEKALGDRWKAGGALSSEDEGRLLRAGVAYSLAGDDAALARLQERYKGYYDQAHNPEALRVALSGLPRGRLTVADFGRATADTEAFAGWVAKMKQRFRQPPAKAPAVSLKQADAAAAPPSNG